MVIKIVIGLFGSASRYRSRTEQIQLHILNADYTKTENKYDDYTRTETDYYNNIIIFQNCGTTTVSIIPFPVR